MEIRNVILKVESDSDTGVIWIFLFLSLLPIVLGETGGKNVVVWAAGEWLLVALGC